jgi:hypothetical protein
LQPLQTSHSSSGDATCAFDTLGIAVAIGTLGAREQSTACQWCTAVHRSTICGCKPVAYRCEQGAPDALKHGCFPATPVTSLKITGGTAAPPVWVDLTALEFVSTLQYRGGGEPSDTAAAGALKHVHEMNYSGPGAHAGVQLMLLSEAALQRYFRSVKSECWTCNCARMCGRRHIPQPNPALSLPAVPSALIARTSQSWTRLRQLRPAAASVSWRHTS